MYIKTFSIETAYQRVSKNGKLHRYTRKKSLGLFRCDNCHTEFQRDIGKMDKRRLSDNYYHVCSNCDSKRFAQKIGSKKRKIWNLSVDTDIDISQI